MEQEKRYAVSESAYGTMHIREVDDPNGLTAEEVAAWRAGANGATLVHPKAP